LHNIFCVEFAVITSVNSADSDNISNDALRKNVSRRFKDSEKPSKVGQTSESWKILTFVASLMKCADCVIRCRLSYYAVFDGHGGCRASKYAAQHLHKIIADKFPKGNVV